MMNVLSPCLAGLDPASHSVKQVGTQRVALDRDSMGLRVKPAKTQAHFDTPPFVLSPYEVIIWRSLYRFLIGHYSSL